MKKRKIKNLKKHGKGEGRRGLSPIISTIILIAIVVIIAILIILWFRVFVKEVVLKEVGGNSKRVEDFCNDVQLKAVSNPDGSIAITNEGNIPVYSIILKTSSSDGSSDTKDLNLRVNPGVSQTVPSISSMNYKEVKIIPVLLGKTKGDVTKPVPCGDSYAIKI